MEKLKLKRFIINEFLTIGELSHNDNFICYILEDPVRDKKIKHITAIPEGSYQIVINYSPKFKRNLPLLLNVPNYSGIRIHKGNFVTQTSGCLITGTVYSDKGVQYSTVAFEKVFQLIQKLLKNSEVWIDIYSEKANQSVVVEPVQQDTSIITIVNRIEEPSLTDTSSVNLNTNQIPDTQDTIFLPPIKQTTTWKNYSLNLFQSILTLFKKLLFLK